MAIEPPDGISSVVSARRVLIEGMVSEFVELPLGPRQRDRVFGRDFRHFGHDPKADPSFGHHHRREVERDAEFLEADDLDALSRRA